MRPLILITNDDGVGSKGIAELTKIAQEFGEVVVMAPSINASAKSHSITTDHPLEVTLHYEDEGLHIYSCNGTPVDCVKLAEQHFCHKPADLVLSGINHGSNSSVNVLYSGTLGAAIEAANNGFRSIGFSLLDHAPDADFSQCRSYIRTIIASVLEKGLPEKVTLNVNFPPSEMRYKGMKVCRESKALWSDSFEKWVGEDGKTYYRLCGNFECNDVAPDTDQFALENGYVSIVPTTTDYTHFDSIETIQRQLEI